MSDAQPEQPWTPAVLELLRDWNRRADASSETHYAMANRLSSSNILLGVPVVVLTTFVGTSVFATLQENVDTRLRIFVGVVSVLAAVFASLQTFLRFGERAEKHRVAAEKWAAIRREITEMLALHPTYLASRGDPKQYLDDLRTRMDEVSTQSPEMPDRRWGRALSHREHDLEERGDGAARSSAAASRR
ncbi:MAG TPA: SLATT domain-containing protein [Gaiellaceae bacterium]|nr:SLATT domain-containing protein [Gaiellaceae bacterium]